MFGYAHQHKVVASLSGGHPIGGQIKAVGTRAQISIVVDPE